MTVTAKDCIGRKVSVGDIVFTDNILFEVLEIHDEYYVGSTPLKIASVIIPTITKFQYSDICCLIPKDDYLIHILKK